MSDDDTGHEKASESNGVSVTDKTSQGGESHDSGARLTLHNKNGRRNKSSKSNNHQARISVKKEKTKQSKKRKSRKGKSLIDGERDNDMSESESENETEKATKKKSSGIRTISVREWLRRG